MSVEILNVDCMEYMATLPDNTFELAIVDPPYGIGECGKTNKSRSNEATAKDYKPFAGGDLEPPTPEYFDELKRVSKNQIIWGANHFINNNPVNTSCWIVWDKVNGKNDFADCELAWTSFKSAVRMISFMWNGMMQGESAENGRKMQGNKKLNEKRIHPTQKPVQLYKWLLNNYAKKGDKILDTHLGSGSSAIASYDFGFDFVGCELDTYYFKASRERVDDYMRRIPLFTEANQ